MRVLLITDALAPETLGGTPRLVWELARSLKKNGCDVFVLTAGKNPGTHVTDGITVHRLPIRPTRWSHYRSVFGRRREREVLSVIDLVKPECIHAHTIAWQCGYRWIAGAAQRAIPIFATAHDVMHVACGRIFGNETAAEIDWKDLKRFRWNWNPCRRFMIRRALAHCTQVFAVSDALHSVLERMGIQATTLHNGIAEQFWKMDVSQNDARHAKSLPANVPMFLLAGRLGIDKGVDVVAEGLPEHAHLILAGAADLSVFAAMEDRCHWFPFQSPEDMRVLYAACDAVLVPSKCLDCFPTMCLEGMAMGKPILATSWGGSKEAVTDGETGWILDPEDAGAWKKRMEWCCQHREALISMAPACRAAVEQRFTQDEWTEKLLLAYRTHAAKS